MKLSVTQVEAMRADLSRANHILLALKDAGSHEGVDFDSRELALLALRLDGYADIFGRIEITVRG